MGKVFKNIMKFFSLIAEFNFVWILMCIFLYFNKEAIMIREIVIAILLVYAINTGLIKTVINRRRPYQDEGETLDADLPEPYGSSFPSNHTTIAVAICGVLLLEKSMFLIPALLLSILIIASKIVLKLNYKSDIVAGILVGILISFITYFIF